MSDGTFLDLRVRVSFALGGRPESAECSPRELRDGKLVRYQQALRDIATDALAVAAGRLGGPERLAQVQAVVVTGRGSLAWGFLEELERALKELGVRARPWRAPTGHLKAAVALGAGAHAVGTFGNFVPSASVHADRILVLSRRADRSVTAVELLPAGVAFEGQAIERPWVEVERGVAMRAIRTWMVPVDHPAKHRWELDAVAISRALSGDDPSMLAHAPGFEPVPMELTGAPWRSGVDGVERLRMRVVVEEGRTARVEVAG